MIKDIAKNISLRDGTIQTSYFYMHVLLKRFQKIQELAIEGKTEEISQFSESCAKDIINKYL